MTKVNNNLLSFMVLGMSLLSFEINAQKDVNKTIAPVVWKVDFQDDFNSRSKQWMLDNSNLWAKEKPE